MKHVFLSYSRADADLMRKMRDLLVDEGITVWTDESLIPGTPSWQVAIQEAIEGAGAIVALLSPDAKSSQWVANELSYAAAQGVTIFPVWIRGEEKEAVPLQLINAQRVDLRTRFLAGMQTLVDALREHLRKSEGADEPPPDSAAWMERGRLYQLFWKMLQERSRGRTDLFANLTALDTYFISSSAGRQGIKIGYVISMDWGSVNLYIDMGVKEKNKRFFDVLYAQREAIEAEFGEPLEWKRLDNKRSSQVTKRFEDGGLDDRNSWPGLIDRMIDAMVRLDSVMRGRLGTIEL